MLISGRGQKYFARLAVPELPVGKLATMKLALAPRAPAPASAHLLVHKYIYIIIHVQSEQKSSVALRDRSQAWAPTRGRDKKTGFGPEQADIACVLPAGGSNINCMSRFTDL